MKNINHALVNATITPMYGSTELGTTIVQFYDEKENIYYNSGGIVLPDVEMKVVDVNTGEILGPNQKGELHFKAKGMIKRYFKNPKTTEEVIDSDGWFHTKDLGYYDKKGYVYYVCRINDIIKFRGHQISPLEIEEVLLKHPDIIEAAVVSVPHALDTEHPIAFVVKTQNSEVSKEELLELTSVLDDTKKLRGGIVFLEKLPKLPTGKVQKNKLKEMAKLDQKLM
ncbi:4-coumarate--CoA ligase-like 2 isoform X2 [Belonocnema kinseyi]|nr:4-coumarate--CoA ligase-like 2 isoform X2 [Belonocnema kinseyi]